MSNINVIAVYINKLKQHL